MNKHDKYKYAWAPDRWSDTSSNLHSEKMFWKSYLSKKHLGGWLEPHYMNQSAVYSMVSFLAPSLIKR